MLCPSKAPRGAQENVDVLKGVNGRLAGDRVKNRAFLMASADMVGLKGVGGADRPGLKRQGQYAVRSKPLTCPPPIQAADT
jgi:hypothetical protein